MQEREGSQKSLLALAGWLSWLERRPVHQRIAGSIPRQGTYLGCGFDLLAGHLWEATSRCFFLT